METMKQPLTVHAYSAVTGAHLARLPYTSCSWSDSINEPGQLSVDVDASAVSNRMGLRDLVAEEKTIVAAQRGPSTIVHAGLVTSVSWDASSRKLSVQAGGGLTMLAKRLVLDHRLADAWHDGEILVDEQHPAGMMRLHLAGSYRDIIRGLVLETRKWEELPIMVGPEEGGDHERNYYAWELAYVADRISDIAHLADAPEIRFDPVVIDGGYMTFRLVAKDEIVDHEWKLNATIPGQRVYLSSYKGDGHAMTSQAYVSGGKDADKLLMARRRTDRLKGYPLMQTADTTHTTVSRLDTLQEYAMAALSAGAWPDETYGVMVGDDYDVRVGDHMDLRFQDDYLGERLVSLKVTDVSGSSDSDWLTLQCRLRG